MRARPSLGAGRPREKQRDKTILVRRVDGEATEEDEAHCWQFRFHLCQPGMRPVLLHRSGRGHSLPDCADGLTFTPSDWRPCGEVRYLCHPVTLTLAGVPQDTTASLGKTLPPDKGRQRSGACPGSVWGMRLCQSRHDIGITVLAPRNFFGLVCEFPGEPFLADIVGHPWPQDGWLCGQVNAVFIQIHTTSLEGI